MKIKVKDINIYDTLFSGQCFRMTKEEDNSYTVVINDRVINIKEEDGYLVVNSSNEEGLEAVVRSYFDLDFNYESVNYVIASKEDTLRKNINLCKGYKILRQDAFEMFITYIISQNNNVKRISKTVEELSKSYGTKVTFNDKDYYLFPTYEQLKDISKEELRSYGAGFRDEYIRFALDYLRDNPTFLVDINNMTTEEALKALTSIKGIGTKVASCILLFGYHRLDTYPIDTWVRKYVSTNFNVKDDIKVISKFMKETFGEYSGLAIQYFFHIERNKSI